MAGRHSSKQNQRPRRRPHADEFDVIIDPIINSILGSVTNSITGLDALLGIDPTAGSDLALPATDAAAADPVVAAASSADVLAAVPAADPSLADLFQTDFYEPLHAADQAWIDSPLGEQFDNAINPLFATGNFCGLICDGTPGTQADPLAVMAGSSLVTAGPAGLAPRPAAAPAK